MNELSLKAARVNAGMSLEEAAKSLGCAKSTLISWEKGRTYPNVPNLKKIEEVYKVDIAFIKFNQHYSLTRKRGR